MWARKVFWWEKKPIPASRCCLQQLGSRPLTLEFSREDEPSPCKKCSCLQHLFFPIFRQLEPLSSEGRWYHFDGDYPKGLWSSNIDMLLKAFCLGSNHRKMNLGKDVAVIAYAYLLVSTDVIFWAQSTGLAEIERTQVRCLELCNRPQPNLGCQLLFYKFAPPLFTYYPWLLSHYHRRSELWQRL